MRLLIYNIAYGTGCPGQSVGRLWTIHRYFRTSHGHFDKIINFIRKANADIVGLVEVDTGSFRTDFQNQVEKAATKLEHYFLSSNKYGSKSLASIMPFMRKHANAILTKKAIPPGKFHYFPKGVKKLIIELNVEGVSFFLVHLALQKNVRESQLRHLVKLAKNRKPLIIAGDFNTFSGVAELEELQKELKLVNPNYGHLPTYPSWKPKKQLDFILCSKDVKVMDFVIPLIKYSDHLPLMLDFEIDGKPENFVDSNWD